MSSTRHIYRSSIPQNVYAFSFRRTRWHRIVIEGQFSRWRFLFACPYWKRPR